MNRTGTAGNHGGGIRSDCRVELKIKSTGGIDLVLDSKVGKLYGKAISTLAVKVLKHFKISNASLLIQDSGALDFVIAARIESAVRQVIETDKEFLLPSVSGGNSVSQTERFRFTRLYIPGNTPSMMINAGLHRPDAICLDLEDSVSPDKKDEARILVRNALRSVDFMDSEKMVRINQLPRGLDDLEAVVPHGVQTILLPKTETAGQLKEVSERIKSCREKHRLNNDICLMPIIETALGVEHAFEIAGASELVVAMAIGLEDYTADMGVPRTLEGGESLYARSRLVNACKAAGIQAIDSVFSDVADEEGLRSAVQRSRSLGFEGMGCIHPRQIPIILEGFQPTKEEIERACRIVDAFELASRSGKGVVSLGSKMIDPPVVKRAQRIIRLAKQMGLIL